MFVEPSALVAILLEEPRRDEFLAKIVQAGRRVTSIAGKIEAALSVGKQTKDYAAAGISYRKRLSGWEWKLWPFRRIYSRISSNATCVTGVGPDMAPS